MGRSANSSGLRTFSCFLTDIRYAVPTLQFVLALDEERARVLALRLLMDDPRHVAVEVREAGIVLFTQSRQAELAVLASV